MHSKHKGATTVNNSNEICSDVWLSAQSTLGAQRLTHSLYYEPLIGKHTLKKTLYSQWKKINWEGDLYWFFWMGVIAFWRCPSLFIYRGTNNQLKEGTTTHRWMKSASHYFRISLWVDNFQLPRIQETQIMCFLSLKQKVIAF